MIKSGLLPKVCTGNMTHEEKLKYFGPIATEAIEKKEKQVKGKISKADSTTASMKRGRRKKS